MLINNGEVQKLICMQAGCGKPVSDKAIKELFKTEPAVLDKLKRFKEVKQEGYDPLLRYCPKNYCKGKVYAKNMKAEKLKCPECASIICFVCKEEWHEGLSCDASFIKKLGP